MIRLRCEIVSLFDPFMSKTRWIWQSPTWPKLSFDQTRLVESLSRARDTAGRLRGKAEAIGADELISIERDVWAESAVATAAIEGETLNLEAVRSSVNGRFGLATTSVPRIPRGVEALLDVMNDAAAHWQDVLTEERLIAWQALICEESRSGLLRVDTGRFRSNSVEVISGPEGRRTVHYVGPPAGSVRSEVRAFLDWFNGARDSTKLDGLLRAGLSHVWFESIHPFADGNGRVGRAVLDMAISQDTKSASRLHGLSIQISADKIAYYDALNRAQRGSGDVTEWLVWFTGTFADSCQTSLHLIDEAVVRARFWSLHKDVPLNARQRKALTRMLGAGPGKFEGGMTPRKYMALTKANNRLTANRDLSDLVEKQLLVRGGAGRSTFYNLAIPGWGWVPGGSHPTRP
jgi:Fic family protein